MLVHYGTVTAPSHLAHTSSLPLSPWVLYFLNILFSSHISTCSSIKYIYTTDYFWYHRKRLIRLSSKHNFKWKNLLIHQYRYYTVTDKHSKSLETFLWKGICTNLNALSIWGVKENKICRYTSWGTTGWRATYVWVAASSLWYLSTPLRLPIPKFAGIQVALFTK